MSKKYEATALDIVHLVGGAENVDSLHHCQTRLRFKLRDDAKADSAAIEQLPGHPKCFAKGGMFQVVIGLDVAECYEEVVKLLPQTENAETAPKADKPAGKKKIFDIVTDFISSIFSPIVPALAGAGMVKALLALLVAFSWIDKSGQVYVLLNLFGDATFVFMPILLAYTTAKKLDSNPVLGMVVAGIMCHATWTGLVAAGEPVSFLGIPFYLVRYTNSTIPIVLVMLVQAALVTGFMSKDSATKQIGISGGITGLMGTTESALYGINVPKKYPLIAGMIGSACGGLYAGLTHTHRYATGSSGLPAVVMYIGDGTMQYFYNIIIAIGITIVVAAAMTVIPSRFFEKKNA